MAGALKILHSYKIFRPDIDGGIPFAIATLSELSRQGMTNEVLVARRLGLGRRYLSNGIAVEAVTSFGTLFSTPVAPIFPFVLLRRASAFDIVVHHAPFPLADLGLPWLPAHVALVVYWHADIMKYTLLKKLVTPAIRRTLARADRIIVSDARNISDSRLLAPFADKCIAVPFGADIDAWGCCDAAETQLSADLRSRSPRLIVALGRLVYYKGLSVLIDAMADIDGQLIVIGEGPLRKDLEQQALTRGVSAKVSFVGRLSASDIKSYLHAARVLAFPSVSSAEAFGIVQIEAMAAGLPIVNTALDTAVPRVARHQIEALTVPPNDTATLAQALRTILDDPVLAARLSTAGRQRAETKYSQQTYLTRITEIYHDVVRNKLTRP